MERAGPTPPADQRVALDDAYFDRGKIALPPGAAADATSADIVIVDGAAKVARAPPRSCCASWRRCRVRGLRYLPHDCSEDLIKAVVGFFTNMSVSGPILNRPVIYTPLPLPSIYCAVNGAVAAVSAWWTVRTGLGREIIASRLARRAVGDRRAQHDLRGAARLSGADHHRRPAAGIDAGTIPHLRRRRDPRTERQMWLERRFAPFSAPYRAGTADWILPMAGPNVRLSRRLLEAMGLWDQALTTGAVFVTPYDPANIAEARRNLA